MPIKVCESACFQVAAENLPLPRALGIPSDELGAGQEVSPAPLLQEVLGSLTAFASSTANLLGGCELLSQCGSQ